MKRKILTMDGTGRFEVQQQDVPSLKEYEVLVEVKASGISPGTELGGIKHLRTNTTPAFEARGFGYQNSGIVIEKGPQVRTIEKGMRIACMGGGAKHASIAAVPQNLCVPIPEKISFEEASFSNLAGTALQAIRRAELEFGENVIIFGLGILGNMIGQLASICGTHVCGVDYIEKRRSIAGKTGFDLVVNPADENWVKECQDFSSPYGIDCAFICFGGDATQLFQNILKVMKTSQDRHFMGRVVIPGGCEIKTRFASSMGNMDIRSSARTGPGYHDDDYEQGKDYPRGFVPWTTKRNIEEFYRATAKGLIDMKSLITHSFPLDKGPDACNLVVDSPDKTLAVVLKP
ncbi:MAG TPA: zinc-binding alcohol dehydrogenase [bacterium]|nr:zinc-binding alcohol dehydrogenase [bacterium]